MARIHFATLCATVFAASAGATAPASVPLVEFPTETAALIEATSDLFDRIEAKGPPVPGGAAPVLGTLGLAKKVSLTVTDAYAEFPADRGPVAHLTGYRINWYPVDRLIGSVDFMGTWNGNRDLVCGFVIWDMSNPSAPALETVVANYLDASELAAMPPAEAHEALLEANCAYGDVDLNYALFDADG